MWNRNLALYPPSNSTSSHVSGTPGHGRAELRRLATPGPRRNPFSQVHTSVAWVCQSAEAHGEFERTPSLARACLKWMGFLSARPVKDRTYPLILSLALSLIQEKILSFSSLMLYCVADLPPLSLPLLILCDCSSGFSGLLYCCGFSGLLFNWILALIKPHMVFSGLQPWSNLL